MNKEDLIEEFLVTYHFVKDPIITLFLYKKQYIHSKTKAILTVDYYYDVVMNSSSTMIQFSNEYEWIRGDDTPADMACFDLKDPNCFEGMGKWIDAFLTRRGPKSKT